jgi:hypothetical protein
VAKIILHVDHDDCRAREVEGHGAIPGVDRDGARPYRIAYQVGVAGADPPLISTSGAERQQRTVQLLVH